MEHTISAPADGEIAGIRYAVGEQVAEGAQLVEFVPAAALGASTARQRGH